MVKIIYNISDGGNVVKGMKGKHHSDEAKKRMSEIHKGKSIPSLKGKKHSEEHKNKVSQSLIGNNRCVGRKPWNKNKSWSEEMKYKLSQASTSRKISITQIDEIKQLYSTKDYTQKQLGKTFNVSASYISKIIKRNK